MVLWFYEKNKTFLFFKITGHTNLFDNLSEAKP